MSRRGRELTSPSMRCRPAGPVYVRAATADEVRTMFDGLGFVATIDDQGRVFTRLADFPEHEWERTVAAASRACPSGHLSCYFLDDHGDVVEDVDAVCVWLRENGYRDDQ